MSDKTIVRMTLHEIMEKRARGKKGHTDWARVDAMTDEEIEAAVKSDPSAAPLTDPAFWKDATLITRPKKVSISIRVDQDILDWFKSRGRGYQTTMNAVLRTYVEAHRQKV